MKGDSIYTPIATSHLLRGDLRLNHRLRATVLNWKIYTCVLAEFNVFRLLQFPGTLKLKM